MNDLCITSFAKGHNFERGIKRLEQNIKEKVNIPFIPFQEYPIGCPSHQISPFAFKFFCINECFKQGFKKILWLDSSVIIKSDINDIIQLLETQGYFFIQNSHSVGEYCHDQALITLKITREESFNIPCLQGTNFGLNLNLSVCRDFLNQLLTLSCDGVTFPGPHNNKNKLASIDNRVAGHRHDQTAMSVIALRLNMSHWWRYYEHKWFIHDRDFVKDVISTVEEIDMSSN